jgi:hypothetical protein
MDQDRIHFLAKACYEAVRVWNQANNDHSLPRWEYASAVQQSDAIEKVKIVITNPDTGSEAQHLKWVLGKAAEGWTPGDKLDTGKKVHPLLVTFDNLPEIEQKKYNLFTAITNTLK